MTEVSQGAEVRLSALDEMHRALGATIVARDGWALPAGYGDVDAEYAAVRRRGAGLIDLSASRARFIVSGTEAVPFLNGLVTNDVKSLAIGSWMHAALPNVQGRLLASMRILHRIDGFLCDTEATTRPAVARTLERFILAGDFRVTELTAEMATISLQGARSVEIMAAVLGREAADVSRGHCTDVDWNGQALTVIRATHTGEDGFDLFVSAALAPALWDALVSAGATPFGFDALEILRIEAGLARYGVDINETNVVLEAGLEDAVSFTKGCYIGQEIIARIKWRGHVAKRLAGLSLLKEETISTDDKVRAIDGKEIGRVTSIAFSPILQRSIALAIIKYDYLEIDTPVEISSSGGEIRALVAELPFVSGSWYESNSGAGEMKA